LHARKAENGPKFQPRVLRLSPITKPRTGDEKMYLRIMAAILMLGGLSFGVTGCSDKSTVKEESEVSTPGGTTTVTKETQVEKSGENPPPAKP
jgi:hypothetical protein